ncbi:beta-glucosidase [Pseudomonas duriflava]|uniref:Beta-glucosidase n=1 Tax=Pseudomonas duriflava TaxID=459528 RepID=A0A562QPJ8_9PSED|nr:beta-glucosidase [Pseudomonas duriflava]TWI58681.1 beta-glucosidase [Pseudomonas duriflava]
MTRKVGRDGFSLTSLSAALLTASHAWAADASVQRESPDQRAEAVVKAMTLDEKIALVHTPFGYPLGDTPKPEGAIGSAAYAPGVPRLGIPALQESDASLGVTNPYDVRPGDNATALPSSMMLAATFSPALARKGGEMVGTEAHAKGFNVMLAGGVNLTREPRNGRNFEYLGEDPLLAGTLAGNSIAGIQSKHVVSTTKHFALNAQETGRVMVSSSIDEAAARESDLLAFQLAIEKGQPGSVMTGYNRYNGDYASENRFLIKHVLKGDWKYKGWVMSDWGATHSLEKAARAGLDQQSGENLDPEVFFGEPLKKAVQEGRVPEARLDDMVTRILRSLFAVGAVDHPAKTADIDYAAHAEVARAVAEQGIVLLKNSNNQLPLSAKAKRIVVIGSHADVGVLSGGGSSQVTPLGSVKVPSPYPDNSFIANIVYHPSAPLKAIQAEAPNAQVVYDSGEDFQQAAQLAQGADAVIVFAQQWTAESVDVKDLSLPDNQDALIQAVAKANPNTTVVLQTGGPVKMPWLDNVPAVVEAWYSGSKGGEAIASVLFGRVNPSGRLPITFPQDESQLPRPTMRDPATTTSNPGEERKGLFSENYNIEGADVGYKWYEREGKKPLFPFGYGLSYTQFSYSNLTAHVRGSKLVLGMDVTNKGSLTGIDTPQFYVSNTDAQDGFTSRLVGWDRVELKPGKTRHVSVTVDPRLVARYDDKANAWRIAGGYYKVSAGANAVERPLKAQVQLTEKYLAP